MDAHFLGKINVNCIVPENVLTAPMEGIRNSWGVGDSQNTKKFKEMYEVELEFPEGWGALIKIPSMGEVWIFYGTAHCRFALKTA